MTQLQKAMAVAGGLSVNDFGWLLSRGRVRSTEPLWGFSVHRLVNGLDTTPHGETALVVAEHEDPLECVRAAIRELQDMGELT